MTTFFLNVEFKPPQNRRPTHYHTETSYATNERGGRILVHVIRCTRFQRSHPNRKYDVNFSAPFLTLEEYRSYFYDERPPVEFLYLDDLTNVLRFKNTSEAASYAAKLCVTLNNLPENKAENSLDAG